MKGSFFTVCFAVHQNAEKLCMFGEETVFESYSYVKES